MKLQPRDLRQRQIFSVGFFCRQDSWYEFRVMAVMVDLISESSNVVGVSSTGWLLCKKEKKCIKSWLSVCLNSLWLPSPDPFPPAELPEEGLARPVVAGVVATICFLAAAVLFSTLAACFVNKQHRRKLKRKPGRSSSLSRYFPVMILS